MLHLGRASLRARLISLVILILLPLITLQAMGIYGRFREQEAASLAANREFADAAGVAFQRYLDTIWAMESAIGEAIAREQGRVTVQEIEELMSSVLSEHPTVTRLVWLSPEGEVKAVAPLSRRGQSLVDRHYVQQIQLGGRRALSNLVTSRFSGEPMLVAAHGVRSSEELIGIVVAEINPEALGAMLPIHRAPEAIFGLVDGQGQIVFRNPGYEDLTPENRLLPADSPSRLALEGEAREGKVRSSVDGETRVMVALPLEEIGWSVFSATSWDEITNQGVSGLLWDLGALLLVVSLSLLGAITLGNSILRPVLAIQQAARDVARGNMGARAASPGFDEVAVTAQTFDQMVERLQQTDRELRLHATRQAVIAQLGHRALAGADLQELMETAVSRTADMLGVELCKVLQLLPDGERLALRAGVGWRPGLVGRATVSAGLESQAGYTLLSSEPVIVEELATEQRFSGPRLLFEHGVVSGLSVVIRGRERPFGVLGAHTSHRRTFTEDDVHFVVAVANVLATAIGRAEAEESLNDLLVREQGARAEAEAARQRLQLMAEASALLTDSLDYQTTLDTISRLIVCRLADWCAITMLDDDGKAQRVAGFHRDPDHRRLVEEMNRHYPPEESAVGRALQTGEPVLYSMVDEQILEREIPREEARSAARALRIRSTMVVPLIARGRTIGALTFARSGETEGFGEEDLALAQELARRAALALDNARLYQRAKEAKRHKEESYALMDTLLNSAPVGFAFLDKELRVVQVNQALASVGQRNADDYLGRRLAEVLPRLSGHFEPILRSVLETGEPVVDYAFSLWRHWLCSIYPVRTPKGQLLGVGVVVTDITNQRRMEEALRESEELLAGQNRVLESIASGSPLTEVVQQLGRFVEEQTVGSSAVVMLPEPAGDRLYHVAPPSSLPEPFWRGMDGLPAGPSSVACGVALLRREIVVAERIADDPAWAEHRELARAHGIAACWSVPVLATDGEALGLLLAYLNVERGPDERELNALQLAARLAGLAVERWRAEQARALKLQSLFQHMDEGVIAINEDGGIWLVNEAAADLLKLERSLEGEPLESVALPEPLAEMLGKAALDDSVPPATLTFNAGDVTVDAHIAPVVGRSGRRFGAIAMLQDSTARAQFRLLEESFVANVSHELRGPLTSISAMVEAMADGVLPEEARPRYLRAMLQEMGRLRRLTHDLLELSRLDAGTVELRLEEFNLSLLFEGMEAKWSMRSNAEGIALVFWCDELWVRADVDRLEQVLTNLLENAVRFTPQGGRIMVQAAAEGSMVRVVVSDTGSGIPREHLPYVWERFYKADQARTRTPESGTGLGLAIVRQWVETMGGTVRVDSEVGHGTSFSFTLPRVER